MLSGDDTEEEEEEVNSEPRGLIKSLVYLVEVE